MGSVAPRAYLNCAGVPLESNTLAYRKARCTFF